MQLFALLKREFVTQLRRKKTFLLLILLVLCITPFMLDIWPSHYSSLRDSARTAQELLIIISILVGAGGVLFVPGIAATTLVSEREQNTWDMLSLTLIGQLKMVVSKLVYSIGLYVLLIIGIAPFAATVFFIVGIDLNYLVYTCYIIILGIITFASMGLLASAYQRTSTRAITHSYIYAVLNLGLGYLIIIVLYGLAYLLFDPEITRMSQLEGKMDVEESLWGSTFVMFIGTVGAIRGGLPVFYDTLLLYHSIMQVSIIVLSLYLTARRLARPVNVVIAPEKDKPAKKKLLSPASTSDFVAIPNMANPIRFREIHFGIAIKRKGYWIVFILMLIVSGVSAYCHFRVDMPMEEIFAITFCINLGLITLFTLTSMANIFTKESELKNLDMLKMTLIPPRAIVWGKLGAGIRIMNRLVLFSLAINSWFMLPMVFEHETNDWDYGKSLFCFFASHGTLWMCGVLCVMVGGLASVLCKKTPAAVVSSFVMVSMLYVGNALCIAGLVGNYAGAYKSWRWYNHVEGYIYIYGSPPLGLLFLQTQHPFRNHPEYYWGLQMLLYSSIVVALFFLIENYYRIRRYNNDNI